MIPEFIMALDYLGLPREEEEEDLSEFDNICLGFEDDSD
jgi:hypothetical protein